MPLPASLLVPWLLPTIQRASFTEQLKLSSVIDPSNVRRKFKTFEFILQRLRKQYTYKYNKALKCIFFGEWKHLCSSKFMQLELLNKTKARTSKNSAA